MCTLSMVAEDWRSRHPFYQEPKWWPNQQPSNPGIPKPLDPKTIADLLNPQPDGPTRAEFDALKKELEALRKLLEAAKAYDAETGQPDCEDAEKVALLRRLAKLVGVEMESVFPAAAAK